jgi:hypothetical protein
MKQYIKTIFCLFLLAALTVTGSYAQVLPDVQNSFNQYNLNSLQEKVFVHTDKSVYTAGEIIWFKIYNVDETYHKPIDLSKVVYVEVLDHDHNAVMQAKIAMKDGAGSGSLYIPIAVTTGNFILRAYTSWMKNFSPEYYFTKKITIINPLKSPDAEPKITNETDDIQFFPEGGNLVNGIASTVAFKAADQWGRGISFKGAIVDQKNDTIVKFAPLKFGIGHFLFKPDVNATYRAIIKIDDKTIQKELPPVNSSGYVMHVNDNGSGQLQVMVNSTSTAGSVYLFAQTRNLIKAVETATITDGTALFNIDKNKLGDGISHITIFNDQRQPVCERLYFKRPVKNLVINATTDQQEYTIRKKVNIDISAKDQNNAPVTADLSLSVYRLDSLQSISNEDIRNYLWLSSDLRGNIESPGYYFVNVNAKTDEAIDNLMLTQGWRRFDWNDVLKNKMPSFNFLPEYNGPIVNAKLVNQLTNKPDKDVVAYLAIPGKRVQVYAAISDSLGRLIFNMKNFYGPGEIVVQTNTTIDTNYHIDVLSPFSEQYSTFSLPPLAITPAMQSNIEARSVNMQVQNVYSGDKLRQFYDPQVDSAFFGTPNTAYLLDNYTRFTTIEEILREYVPNAFISHLHDHFHIKVLNENGVIHEDDPMVLIDGVPFFNIDKVFAADPLKLRKLEVVPYTYYWGPSVEEGILSFTSYKGDMGGNEIDPHAVVLDYEGLELQRQFYSPVYDSDKAYVSRVPDFRNVLYWAPYVTTGTNGKNSVSFYTSDQTGSYIGIIQGLTANGEAGSQYFRFDVKK